MARATVPFLCPFVPTCTQSGTDWKSEIVGYFKGYKWRSFTRTFMTAANTAGGSLTIATPPANDPAFLEKLCAYSVVALASINTPNTRIQLRSGVSEVAIQYAPVEVYEGDVGWYFVANLIIPISRTAMESGPIWTAVNPLAGGDLNTSNNALYQQMFT